MAPEERHRPTKPKNSGTDQFAYPRADNLRQLLLGASRVINRDVTAASRDAGFEDLKNSQVFCLAHIDLDGTNIVDLAERSNISKQAASKLVSELVALGYLLTSRAPSDRRAILVQFTPRGRSLMRKSFDLFAELEREYCRKLGAQDYAALRRALRALGEPRHFPVAK